MVEELEITEQVEQQQDPPTKKRALYDAVSKKYNLGSYEEFETKLKDPTKRKALYDHVGKEFELGTFQDFETKLQEPTPSKKKVGTVATSTGEKVSSPTQSSSNPPSLFGKFPTKDELGYKQENVLPSINSMKQPAIKDEARIVKPIVGETLDKELANRERYQKAKDNKQAEVVAEVKSMLPKNLGGTMEKDKLLNNRRGGYVYNKLLDGIEGLGAGAMDLVITGALADARLHGVTMIGDKPLEQIQSEWRDYKEEMRGTVTKMAGAEMNDEKNKKYEKELFSQVVGGLAYSAPAMFGGYPALVAQGVDAGLQSINSTEAGRNLPETEKSLFAYGTSLATSALDLASLNVIFGKQTSKVAANLAARTMADLAKKSKAPITTEMFEEALKAGANDLKQLVLDKGKKVATAMATEGATEGLQEGISILAENATNKVEGKQIFEPTSWAKRMAIAAGQGALGGGLLGGISMLGDKTRNYIAEKVSNAKSAEDIEALKAEVVQQAESGNATPEETKAMVDLVGKYAEVNTRIPKEANNRKAVADKIIERDSVEEQIAAKTEEIKSVDPAFRTEAEAEIGLLNERVNELNGEIVSESKSPQKDGTYIIDGNEVTEQQFNEALDKKQVADYEYNGEDEAIIEKVKQQPQGSVSITIPEQTIYEEPTTTDKGVGENPALKDEKSTVDAIFKAIREKGNDGWNPHSKRISDALKGDDKSVQEAAKQYHQAKKDGSNDELVKAVEAALSPTKSEPTVKEETSTVSDVSGDVKVQDSEYKGITGTTSVNVKEKDGIIKATFKGTRSDKPNATIGASGYRYGGKAVKETLSDFEKDYGVKVDEIIDGVDIAEITVLEEIAEVNPREGVGTGQAVTLRITDTEGNIVNDVNIGVNKRKFTEQSKTQPTNEAKANDVSIPTEVESTTNKEVDKVGEAAAETQKTEAGEPPIEPPVPPVVESEGSFVEPKRTKFSHRGLQEVATEFGLNDITSREKVSDLELFKRADETITKWQSDGTYQKKVNELIDKAKLGEIFSPEQNVIMAQHIANMREKTAKVRDKFGINSPEYNKALQELQNITTIGQKVRSDIGAALRVPNISRTYMETLDEAMAAKMEAAGVDVLTEKQKAEVEGLFNEYKKRAEVAEAKLNEANQRLSEFNAEQALKKGTYGKKTTPKTKEEFKEQRKSLKEKLQQQIDEYKAAGQKLGISSDGGTESFIISTKIAKTVLEIVRSHVAEVGVDLKEVTKKTFEDVKDLLKGISEKDVHDIIAGEYNEKRKTRNQLAADMRDVKDEATLINKLNKLLNGEIPTKESAVVERNSNIKELREKIKGLKDEMPLTDAEIKSKLLSIKKRNEAFAKKIREDIENGNFEKEPKKSWIENKEFKAKFPVLFKEALNSIAEREDAKHEMDIALYKDQQSKRNVGQKFLSFLGAGANTTKKIVTGVDDSALGIQTLAAMIARPVVGGRAIKLHAMDAFSQKRFERTLAELHNSPDYDLMIKSGLDITEPKSLLAEKKEEIFSGNTWDIKFKLNGKEYKVLGDLLKPFERAFTSLGNGMRVIAFRTIADKLAKEGRTFENSPQIYKDLATMLNTETGRGKQNEYIQKASELVTKGIWSPRLMASRLNMLGISDVAALIPGKTGTKGYYNQLDPRIRKEALVDLVKFSTGVLALSYLAAWALGGELDKDPKSQTFMDIKVGDKSYNLSGGFSQYIRFVAQSLAGGKTSNGEFKKFDNRVKDRGTNTLHFLRGKVTPMTGVGIDLLTGTDFVGNPVELDKEIKKLVIPLSLGSLASGIEKDGASSLFTTTFPNFVGVNVKDKQDFIEQDLDVPEWRFLSDKGLRLTKKSKESLKPVDADGKPIEVTEDKYKDFLKKREEYVRQDIEKLMRGEGKIYAGKEDGWVDLPKEKLKDVTYKEMQSWIMSKTDAANDKAMKEVFPNVAEPPEDNEGKVFTQ